MAGFEATSEYHGQHKDAATIQCNLIARLYHGHLPADQIQTMLRGLCHCCRPATNTHGSGVCAVSNRTFSFHPLVVAVNAFWSRPVAQGKKSYPPATWNISQPASHGARNRRYFLHCTTQNIGLASIAIWCMKALFDQLRNIRTATIRPGHSHRQWKSKSIERRSSHESSHTCSAFVRFGFIRHQHRIIAAARTEITRCMPN